MEIKRGRRARKIKTGGGKKQQREKWKSERASQTDRQTGEGGGRERCIADRGSRAQQSRAALRRLSRQCQGRCCWLMTHQKPSTPLPHTHSHAHSPLPCIYQPPTLIGCVSLCVCLSVAFSFFPGLWVLSRWHCFYLPSCSRTSSPLTPFYSFLSLSSLHVGFSLFFFFSFVYT